ncbi:MAG: aspartate aminotransferase family protein [Bacillota bacterium]
MLEPPGEVSRALIAREERAVGTAIKIRFFPLVVDRARGARLWDVDGREYLDFTAGWAVANTGYGHPRVVEAVKAKLDKITFASFTSVVTEPSVRLAERLCRLVPGRFQKRCWFGLSGSDANDCIAKMLPLATGRPRLLSFVGAYHGQTGGSLSLSGHSAQARFPGSGAVVKVPYPYCYRCPFGKEHPGCGLFCLRFIEDYVFKTICPPGDTAAVVVEAIQSDGGDVVPPDDFLPALAELCQRCDIRLVTDEVKVGFGRTGRMFAFEHSGVVPDAVTMAKPIASGFPLSAVVARKEILDAGVATHLFTTGGHPVGCATALATIDIIEQERLAENAARVGARLKSSLEDLQSRCPLIGDVRGKGLIIGVELVRDLVTREPATRETAKVVYRCFELGLVVFYVGIHSNVIEITPPLTLTADEADQGVRLLARALDDVIAGRVPDEKVARYAGW